MKANEKMETNRFGFEEEEANVPDHRSESRIPLRVKFQEEAPGLDGRDLKPIRHTGGLGNTLASRAMVQFNGSAGDTNLWRGKPAATTSGLTKFM